MGLTLLPPPPFLVSFFCDESKLSNAGYSMIPAAFGDFNNDKLTDMIVLKSTPNDDISTLQILLAKEPKDCSSQYSSQ